MNNLKRLKILIFNMALMSVSLVHADCFPSNDLSYPVSRRKSLSSVESINEFQANQIIINFKSILKNEVRRQLGKEIIVSLDWENPKVNASATLDDNDNPVISIYGGMVRHPDLTVDGLYAILCHELGHHLGGAPKKKRGYSDKLSWSSAEGQSDYYAATKCLPLIFNNSMLSPKIDMLAQTKELATTELECGNDLTCTRILLSGYSVAKVFATLRDYFNEPSLTLRDRNVVWETDTGHPHPQCRLDTIRSGALCSVSPALPFDSLDPHIGSCYEYKNDQEAELGARPRCWFNPEEN